MATKQATAKKTATTKLDDKRAAMVTMVEMAPYRSVLPASTLTCLPKTSLDRFSLER